MYQPSNDGGALRGGIVVVHGYADHCGRYAEVAKRLAAQGFLVTPFDYRGHGRADGQRGHCDHFEQYLGDLKVACADVHAAVEGKPMLIVAHSHGSLMTLRLLCEPGRTPPGVVGAVLSSPFLGIAMKVNPVKVFAARLASRFAPKVTMDNQIDAKVLSHDPAVLKAHDLDGLCHKATTPRWFTEMSAAQAYVVANAGRISIPTLWQVAGDDRLVDASVTLRAYEKAGGKKHLVKYDGFFHEVFNEVERARVFKDLDDWIASVIPRA